MPLDDWQQALLLYAVSEGFADKVEISELPMFEKELFPFFEEKYPDITEKLKSGAKADCELLGAMSKALGEYAERY